MDFAGVALVVTAIGAVIGPAVNAYLQLKAARTLGANKKESMAAREAQNEQIAEVHTLVKQVAANGNGSGDAH